MARAGLFARSALRRAAAGNPGGVPEGIRQVATQRKLQKSLESGPRAGERSQADTVTQRWWTGKPALPYDKFQIDTRQYDLKKILSERSAEGKITCDPNSSETIRLRKHMNEVFDEVGVLQLKNTGIDDLQAFDALTRLQFPSKPKVYEGGANQRAPIEGNVYDVGAPGAAELAYHHEMAYITHSVKWLSFGCINPLPSQDGMRGCTYVADNSGATKMLMETELGEKLKNKGLCYIRKLPDRKYFRDNNLDDSIVYNFWQTSMLTEDMDEAEEEARRQGLEVEWEESPIFGRYMVTKYYASCFEYDPNTDKNNVFASVADDYVWFQSWPGIAELPHWERPLKLNYGDDSLMTIEEKQQFVDIYDQHGVPIMWEKGDLALMCNWRFAHGRPGYTVQKEQGETRELGVILGEEFSRVGPLEGKW